LIGKYILQLPKTGFLWAELVCIASVLIITMIGRQRDWHGRWMESREVAERLRMAMPLWLLGQRASRFSGEEPAWTGWYVRAHLRALGLASAALAPERLAAVKELLKTLVEGQCAYHGANTATMGKVERRLESLGEVAFFATFLVAAAYLALTYFDIKPSDDWSITVTALTAGLPALGAASYGVRLIGDFEGIAARSERTGAALEAIGAALDAHPPELAPLSAAAQAASATMLGDVASWRLSSETRKLAIPC
jgi:hypothetical protein